MKHWSTLFFICGLVLAIQAQCPDNDIVFKTQQEIDTFLVEYPNCENFEHNILISSTSSDPVVNLNGLSKIKAIKGNLTILFNDSLEYLIGLENLESISGELEIGQNPNFKSLEHLNSLIKLGSLNLSFDMVKNFKGLENIDSLENLKLFNNNLESRNLTGLENIKYISLVELQGNIALDGFPSLSNINLFSIVENECLKSCKDITNHFTGSISFFWAFLMDEFSLEGVELFDTISMISLGEIGLLELEGLSKITYQIDNLSLRECNSIETLAPISNVKINTLSLWKLEKLNAFGPLSYCKRFFMKNLPMVTTLSDLQNLENLEEIGLEANLNLNLCNIQPVCDIIINDPTNAFIQGNSNMCNSVDEVGAQCLSSSNDNNIEYKVYPNPSSQFIHFSGLKNKISVDIFSLNGIFIKSLEVYNDRKLDIGFLPPDIYIIKHIDSYWRLVKI